MTTRAFATSAADAPLAPFSITRREPREHDVAIAIAYCGVCHSDLHQARNEWNSSIYPMVPGHEIVGRVTSVGAGVKSFKPGDLVGVGCMIDSCRECASCAEGLEQYCERGFTGTYNTYERRARKEDPKVIAFGGYSEQIVVNEGFVVRVPAKLDLAKAAPLLCAGITTYSPLRRAKVGKGTRVGVVGLGGLGHVGVKIARAMGAEVVVLTTSAAKKADALALGAHEAIVWTDAEALRSQAKRFDFLLDTVAADHDIGALLGLLRRDGEMTLVGAPAKPMSLGAFGLIVSRRSLSGSMIGGIRETQEMLDFCAEHAITADIEMIPMQGINEAYDRLAKSDVKYRFVIDIDTLRR
jgi:alcohol dehydrogenase (NADP+)